MVQTFNPGNVVTTAVLPTDVATEVLDGVMKQSAVLRLAKNIDMQGKPKKKFSFITGVGGAYWTGETQRIVSTKAETLQATLESHKLATMIPVSKELLKYSDSDFFNEIKPLIIQEMYKAIDLAVLKGINSPYAKNIAQAVKDSGNVINGEINYDNILALEDKLYEKDVEANAFVSTKLNNPKLRTAIQQNAGLYPDRIYDASAKTIDGMPVVDAMAGVLDRGDLITGNFDYLYYGIPGNIEVEVSDQAQISTITNEDGTPINLFEQEMVALKVTMDVAVLPVKPDAFAAINVSQSAEDAAAVVPGNGTDTTDKKATKNNAKAKKTATSTETSATSTETSAASTEGK